MNPDEYGRIYAAEQGHWWYQHLHALVLSRLTRHLQGNADSRRILDAGCGTGAMAMKLSSLGAVTAMDFSPHALHFSRLRCLPRLVAGSVNALPFAGGTFDAVVCLDVLYHEAVTDDQQAIRELTRVLRPGGLLLLNLPAYDWLRGQHDVVIHTRRRYTRQRILPLLKGAGLEPIWTSYWNMLLFPAAAAIRLRSRLRRPNQEAHSDVGPVPAVLNRALSGVTAIERRLMDFARLPFGLSVMVVARRPGRAEDE